jgi:RNA polymerase sigma-70 factor (ECF subfamily)
MALPAYLKDVVILYYYQEFKTVEISKILGIAEGTVRSRLHRAREILKNKLSGRVDYFG